MAKKDVFVVGLAILLGWATIAVAEPMGTAWTYQGRLMDANAPADGLYDLRFRMFDSPSGPNQVGGDVYAAEWDVMDGYFTVLLDFNDPNLLRKSRSIVSCAPGTLGRLLYLASKTGWSVVGYVVWCAGISRTFRQMSPTALIRFPASAAAIREPIRRSCGDSDASSRKPSPTKPNPVAGFDCCGKPPAG